MKKFILLSFFLSSIACTNPEDSANNHTDLAKRVDVEGGALNTPPGPTTPNTSAGARPDTSNAPAIGVKKDSAQ